MKEHELLVQETSEEVFTRFDVLPAKLQRVFKQSFCKNCNDILMGRMHYVLTDKGRIIWWHQTCNLWKQKMN